MSRAVPAALKKKVAIRANFQCEYCLLSEKLSFYSFHIEHIRSIKHGGTNAFDNLAYCCPDCNFYKGSDVGTFVNDDETVIRFFNPRRDSWITTLPWMTELFTEKLILAKPRHRFLNSTRSNG
ncbi:HNH endonuclease [Nibrella saemangeumensis]|uniref:HNH endonuclease n=1 Tax=Nibrella saemangeumensis TaxID=1084526 RepID=UPI003CD06BAA